jgi:hypothetical protein
VKRFVDAYAGTPGTPVPFVGRDSELDRLRSWYSGGNACFVTGGAGRGKSALLLNFVSNVLVCDEAIALIFLPISIRFDTSDELRGLRLLQLQLSGFFAELRFDEDVSPDRIDLRARINKGWEFIANHFDTQFLLVIDGADEAVGAWIAHDVLP